MDTYPLVVLANEPSSFRSLLAEELPFLRPNLRVLEIDPGQLETTVAALRPTIVICSRALEMPPTSETSLLLLYCEEIATSLHTPGGTIVNPRLSEILAEIDRVVALVDRPGPVGDSQRQASGRAGAS